jgi:hypothetical protein
MPLLNSNVSNSAIPILETILSGLSSYWLVKVIYFILIYLIVNTSILLNIVFYCTFLLSSLNQFL